MKKSVSAQELSASQLIDARIAELGDWRGAMLKEIRAVIHDADPDVVETWKWRGVPVWEHAGIICTGETYKAVVKMTFAKGASLPDPAKMFNSSLEGNTRRAIDVREGDVIVSFDGAPITGADDLHKLLTEDAIGRDVTLRVLRGAGEREVHIAPAEMRESA